MSMVKPRGLVEVVIDEKGRVVGMSMRQSLHPAYDALILNAAREWKYQPARVDGQPVQFRRLISVAVKR
jgi:TonB family protein